MVVERIFLHLPFKVCPRLFLLKKGKLRVIEQNPVTGKGQDFILVSTEVDFIAQMIFIVRRRFRLRLSFGWRCVQHFTNSLVFPLLLSAFLLLLKPCRVQLHFFRIQVSVHANQLGDPFFNLIPFQRDTGVVFSKAPLQGNTLAIVLLINASAGDNRISAAPAILVFEEVSVFLCRQALLKLLIDSEFTL